MDIPELDMDDFMGYLTNDRELDPDESATLKSLFSDRLLGIDSPLPSMTMGGSRQGSALQARELRCLPQDCCQSCNCMPHVGCCTGGHYGGILASMWMQPSNLGFGGMCHGSAWQPLKEWLMVLCSGWCRLQLRAPAPL